MYQVSYWWDLRLKDTLGFISWTKKYIEAWKQLIAAKEQKNTIKKNSLKRSKGSWEAPINELDMDELTQRVALIQKIHKHV